MCCGRSNAAVNIRTNVHKLKWRESHARGTYREALANLRAHKKNPIEIERTKIALLGINFEG